MKSLCIRIARASDLNTITAPDTHDLDSYVQEAVILFLRPVFTSKYPFSKELHEAERERNVVAAYERQYQPHGVEGNKEN